MIRQQATKEGWVKEDGAWCFYKNNEKSTGWILDNDKWYYLKSSGAMAVNEWVDGGKYYVDAKGEWVPGKKK